MITHFRIIPTITSNPLTGVIDVSFQPGVDSSILLEDVMALIENAHTEQERIIVVLDEFQEIIDLALAWIRSYDPLCRNKKTSIISC